jgi:hypothetical protein
MPGQTPTNSDDELVPPVNARKKRGRPKGSKNKVNIINGKDAEDDTYVQRRKLRLTTSAIKFRLSEKVDCQTPTGVVGAEPESEVNTEHADPDELTQDDDLVMVTQGDAERSFESWDTDEFADQHEKPAAADSTEHGEPNPEALEPHADVDIVPEQFAGRLDRIETMLESCFDGIKNILQYLEKNQLRQQTPDRPKV